MPQTTVARSLHAVLLTCLFTVALIAAGCAATSGSPGPASDPAGAEGPATPKVNRLVFAISTLSGVEFNRPHQVCCTSFLQLAPMYEFLMGVTVEGKELVPQLATEWNLEPDGKSYRFKLRKGVPFHNGFGELTAKDIRYTWEDMKNETDLTGTITGQPGRVSQREIQDVEIVNDYEVVMRVNQPNSGWLPAVSQAESVFAIRSKADGDTRSRPPTLQDLPLAGTGSYQYVTREQGQFIRYKRIAEQHWRKSADFPELEYRIFKEPSTMLAALLAKEGQIAALPPELVPQAEQAGFKAIAGKALGQHAFINFYGVWVNTRMNPQEKLNPDPNAPFVNMNTPLLDVRVRKALNKAIDRDALNKAFIRGRGYPLYVEYFHANRPGWNPAWERNFKEAYGYDPAAARSLLAEAGYGANNPMNAIVRLTFYGYFPGAKDVAEAIANYWRAVGVNVKLDQPDPVAVLARDRALESEPRSQLIVTGIRQWLGVDIYSSALGTTRGFQLPELDDVYKEIRVTLDPAKYDVLWRKWGDLAYERYPNVPLFWIPSEAVVDPAIVADYPFPGSITIVHTHMEYIKAAR